MKASIRLVEGMTFVAESGSGHGIVVDGSPGNRWAGSVALVGVAADPATGRVPVLVRLANEGERLRCYVPVKVRFPGGLAAR